MNKKVTQEYMLENYHKIIDILYNFGFDSGDIINFVITVLIVVRTEDKETFDDIMDIVSDSGVE